MRAGRMAHRLFEFAAAVVATARLIGWPRTIVDRVQFTYFLGGGLLVGFVCFDYYPMALLMRRFDNFRLCLCSCNGHGLSNRLLIYCRITISFMLQQNSLTNGFPPPFHRPSKPCTTLYHFVVS